MNLQSLLGYNDPKPLIYTNSKNKDDKPLTLMVYSTNSKVYKDAFRQMQIKSFELLKDENNIGEFNGQKNLKVELLNELGIELISKLVISWDGLIDSKTKKKVPFDPLLLKEIMLYNDDLVSAISSFAEDTEGNFHEA